MIPEQRRQVKEVLAGVLELASGERGAYLDKNCADASLRREVESLIAAHESGDKVWGCWALAPRSRA
jgi:hypothetical protein